MMINKRQDIIEKVSALYHEFGVRSVTMDDVVREIGISKKTLYQFFSNKEELVSAVMDYQFESRKKEIDRTLKGKKNAIEEMLTYYAMQLGMIREYKPTLLYDLKKYYPEIFEKVTIQKRKYIYDSVLQNLKSGKKEGLYRADINEEILARLNVMRIEAIRLTGIFTPEEIKTPAFFKEVFTYHIYGIVSTKGRNYLEQNIDKLK